MTSLYVWIGIVAAVFVAGLGMGYVAFQQSTHVPYMMNQQQMQYMMNDPQTMNQWHQQMMQNPEAMTQWMNTMADNPEAMTQWMHSPQHIRQMTELMKDNHDFMQEMMMDMINDPNIRLQMIGHMTENPEAMEQMRMMVNGTGHMGNMGQMMYP